jgi:hypothetical protein
MGSHGGQSLSTRTEDKALFDANLPGREGLRDLPRPDDRGAFAFESPIAGARITVTAEAGGRWVQQPVPPLEPGEVRDLGELTLREVER